MERQRQIFIRDILTQQSKTTFNYGEIIGLSNLSMDLTILPDQPVENNGNGNSVVFPSQAYMNSFGLTKMSRRKKFRK